MRCSGGLRATGALALDDARRANADTYRAGSPRPARKTESPSDEPSGRTHTTTVMSACRARTRRAGAGVGVSPEI